MSPFRVAAARGLADPRPLVVTQAGGHLLDGARCLACSHALALKLARCPRCGGELEDARFGPAGSVWALTVVHVASSADEELPYTLAYVDLDDGPRLLARLLGAARVGSRVALTASSASGNATVEVLAG